MASRVFRALAVQSYKQCSARLPLCAQYRAGAAQYSTGQEEHLAQFPGARAAYTQRLDILQPDVTNGIPIYRVMDRDGSVFDPSQVKLSLITLCNLLKFFKILTILFSSSFLKTFLIADTYQIFTAS